MKIGKSKKELARIISERGGWRNGEFAAQDGDGDVGGYGVKPVWSSLGKYWRNEAFGEWFVADKIKNHHQTVLSREEYFHLYPAPDADGWIEWSGGECPVDAEVLVDLKWGDGFMPKGAKPRAFRWKHLDSMPNIIAYRLHKPAQAKPEFCESVTRSIPEPTPAPTLDQLLQDWRNADDLAKRKQAEADEAAAMRDERWKAVQARAGEMGVTVGRCESAVATDEPELVITDWRNLLVGDEIEVVESKSSRYVGLVGVVSRFDEDDELQPVRVIFGGSECNYDWPAKWRFIRRP